MSVAVVVTTPTEFKSWVLRALPGEECVYYKGVFCYGSPCKDAAMQSAEAGEVFLFQRRFEGAIFTYHARRLTKAAGAMLAPKGEL